MVWLGSIDGSREIIKERPLMERERAVGVKVSAYLGSKAIVLFALVAMQALLLVAVTFGIRPLDEMNEYLKIFAICSLTGFVSVGMGLLISALVSSEDQAASFIPLALIPQLLFGGAIVAVRDMGGVISGFSNVIYSRWAFADVGSAVDMKNRILAVDPNGELIRYAPDFFNLKVLPGLGILAAFTVVVFGVTYMVLKLYRRQG
jgi:ABC-type multidrug transport system permease subunit